MRPMFVCCRIVGASDPNKCDDSQLFASRRVLDLGAQCHSAGSRDPIRNPGHLSPSQRQVSVRGTADCSQSIVVCSKSRESRNLFGCGSRLSVLQTSVPQSSGNWFRFGQEGKTCWIVVEMSSVFFWACICKVCFILCHHWLFHNWSPIRWC